jgi:hypothetical protein
LPECGICENKAGWILIFGCIEHMHQGERFLCGAHIPIERTKYICRPCWDEFHEFRWADEILLGGLITGRTQVIWRSPYPEVALPWGGSIIEHQRLVEGC